MLIKQTNHIICFDWPMKSEYFHPRVTKVMFLKSSLQVVSLYLGAPMRTKPPLRTGLTLTPPPSPRLRASLCIYLR